MYVTYPQRAQLSQVLKGGVPIKEYGLYSKRVSALKDFNEKLIMTRFAVVLRK